MWISDFTNIWLCRKTKKQLETYKNNFVFRNEFMRNMLDALNRYEFEGLPDTCSQHVMLESLLFNGTVILFEKNGSLLSLPGRVDGSKMNNYGDFGKAWVYGMAGFTEDIKIAIPGGDESAFLRSTIGGEASREGKGVLIRENIACFPFINYTIYYSERMADSLRKIEVAQRNAASPYIIACEESVIPTVRKFMEARDNNEDYIISSGVFPADKISLLPFDIQADSIKTMSENYDWYSNHYRELCSIKNNSQMDKKGENLISTEVDVNDEYTESQVNNVLDSIQEGLDLTNKLFGCNIKVKKKGEEKDADLRGVDENTSGPVSGNGDRRSKTDNI